LYFLIILLISTVYNDISCFLLNIGTVDGCSATSGNFGVLAGEDEGISFYSAILAVKVSITLTLKSDITKKKTIDKYLS